MAQKKEKSESLDDFIIPVTSGFESREEAINGTVNLRKLYDFRGWPPYKIKRGKNSNKWYLYIPRDSEPGRKT